MPLALLWGWVCFGGLAGDIFHLGVSMRGFPRMVGLLAALLEVCLPGLAAGIPSGCLRFYDSLLSREGGRVFWFWHSGMGVAPGNVPYSHHGFTPDAGSICPSLPFPDGSLSLRCLFRSARCYRSPGLLRFSRNALGYGVPVQLSPFRGCLFGSSEHGGARWSSSGHPAGVFSV